MFIGNIQSHALYIHIVWSDLPVIVSSLFSPLLDDFHSQTCGDEERCEVMRLPCTAQSGPCPPSYEAHCVPICPEILCTLFCEHGFKKDANGCDICDCVVIEDPCKVYVTFLLPADWYTVQGSQWVSKYAGIKLFQCKYIMTLRGHR